MKFKRNLIGVLVAMTLNPAYADTASISGSGMGLLSNEWVKAGVNANTGTLGSGGGTSPGLLFDPTHSGTFNPSFDYLTPGSPFDGFSLKVDSANKTNNNTGTEQITGQGVSLSNSNQTLTWSGSATYGSGTWTVANAYTLAPNTPYIDITTTIVAGGAATNVYFAKFIDPDSQGMAGDSSSTDNVLGYGVIPSTNVAFSEATVSRYALGLYSSATNVAAGINGWNTDAASYVNADASCGTGVLYCNGDDTIGLTFHWTSVTAGATLTASYAYIFGPSAFGAASSAVTGGAGGGTPGTAPGGGTLVDVGSATDAATSGGSTPPAPTITGTSTVNGTPTHADVNGTGVAISTSVVADDYTTRTYNTQTTTEVGRTTTTPTTVVTTWSDSSTTSAAGAPIVVPETYYHTVDVTHADSVSSRTPNAAGRTHVDTGSVTLATPDVTASTNFSTRYGYDSTAGTISRTSTTPTLFTYHRTTTTVTLDDFASTSSYVDATSTTTATSTVTANYNVITAEDFTRTVTKDVVDTMTGSAAITPGVWVSNGIDLTSLVATISVPTLVNGSKYSSFSVSGGIVANELYTITTPTRFTYNRVVTTGTLDTFGSTSVYTNNLVPTQTTENSVVTGDYNVITYDSIQRTAGFDVGLRLRTDQIKTVNDVQNMINRNTEFGHGITYKRYNHNTDGYSGDSNQFSVGYARDIAGDMNLGFGINKIDTSLKGNNSSVKLDTVQLGATLKKTVKGIDLAGTVQHSWNNYDGYSTPILTVNTYGDSRLVATQTYNYSLPNLKGDTHGTDTSISLKATGPGTYIRPVVGYTLGHRNVDGYTARMEILPGLAVTDKVGSVSDTYSYATLGAVAKYGMFNATALHYTDGVNQLGVGLTKSTDKVTFNLRADRLETKDGGSNLYTANMVYMF